MSSKRKGNINNLIPIQTLPKERQAEIRALAVAKCREIQEKKKTSTELLKIMLTLPLDEKDASLGAKELVEMGFPDDLKTQIAAGNGAMIKMMKEGDTKAANLIYDRTEGKAVQQVNVQAVVATESLDKVMNWFGGCPDDEWEEE